jgi:hypothetical protein
MLLPVISAVWCAVVIVAELEGNRLCLKKGSTAKFCVEGLQRRDVTSRLSVPLRDCDRACSEKQVRSEAVSVSLLR